MTEPAIINHALSFYKTLKKQSVVMEIGGEKLQVFTGTIVQTYKSCGIPMTYYSPIRAMLLDVGAIEIISRGNRGDTTLLVCHFDPTSEQLQAALDAREDLTPAQKAAKLSARVEAIERFIENLPGGFNIVDILQDHESRLSKLEQK